MNILTKIIEHKQKEVAEMKHQRPLESFINKIKPSQRDFKQAISSSFPPSLTKRGILRVNLIAEIKQASPSTGIIRPDLDDELTKIVQIYNQHAVAISVLTDQKFFHGSVKRLQEVRNLTHLPLLCKDFIIDEYQIYQACEAGADAILLFAKTIQQFNNETMTKFIQIARKLNMDCLVEVHSESEIKTALASGAEIIGINNRDLTTFKVTVDTTLKLIKYIPKNTTTVSESGFRTKNDIKCVAGKVNAVLIGTIFMKARNINNAINNLGF